MAEGQKQAGVTIRRTAGEVKRYRLWTKFLPIVILVAALVLVVGYVASVLYMKFGAFTVSVNKFDNHDYALSLSEAPGFDVYTSRLNAEIAEIVAREKQLRAEIDKIIQEIEG